jgi:hypothetical protein
MAEERTQRRLGRFRADVAGYSRLMGADEEGTLARLKVLRRDLLLYDHLKPTKQSATTVFISRRAFPQIRSMI